MKVFPIKDEMISSLTLSLRKVYSNRKIPTYWLNFISRNNFLGKYIKYL